MNSPMSAHINFQTIDKSFITLFRVSTGEAWNDLKDALSREYRLDNQCIKNPTYEDYVANGYEPIGCGNKYVAGAFFYSYILVVVLIFLNLLIAVILDGYVN
jgi:hypothetical protein